MTAPEAAPLSFDPDAPKVEDPATPEKKVIRQVTLTQYEGGGFSIAAPPTEGIARPLADDLPGIKGILDYALRYINHLWDLGEMEAKWETQQRLMEASAQRVQPVPSGVLGSAGRFFGGGSKRH